MRTTASVAVLMAVVLLGGCRQHASDELEAAAAAPPPPQPMTDQERARIAAMNPGALIGRIVAVTPTYRMVAVADIAAQNIRDGDAFVLMGAEGALGTAVVVSTDRNTLYLRYEQVTREPLVGDLAVRFQLQ